MGFDMLIIPTGSHASLLPKIRKMILFGRRGPASQILEEFGLVSNDQESFYGIP